MRRLGKMPSWQKLLVMVGMLSCSLTGSLYLLGHEWQIERALFANHTVLAGHGLSAILATLALGSILPFHIKAGYQSGRKRLSGFSQLVFMLILLTTGGLLYYGPAETRDLVIYVHWVVGVGFFATLLCHGIMKWGPPNLQKSTVQ
jgi:ABC-type transport system involved in cytochrome c biogenesis permease subunit